MWILIQMVNPANTYDYSADLLQFVLSNQYVDVALVGMRTSEEFIANVAVANDTDRRIDIDAVHERYVSPE